VIAVLAALLGSRITQRARGGCRAAPAAGFPQDERDYPGGQQQLQGYGPPYSPDTGNAQRFLAWPRGLAGVTNPSTPRDFILQPLGRVALLNRPWGRPAHLPGGRACQQQAWLKVTWPPRDGHGGGGQVQFPAGEYGPFRR